MNTVKLIETNAGFLFIGTESGPWFEAIGEAGTFAADATALAAADTDDWTVERFDAEPQGDLVGEWIDGMVHPIVNYYTGQPVAGIAATNYMGLDNE